MDRRVAIKGTIKAILLRENIQYPAGKSSWSKQQLSRLSGMAAPLDELELDQL